jgi:hypothetical protein
VITTASAANHEPVRGLGADEFTDYNSQDFTKVVSNCDAVFDTVGGEVALRSFAVLKPRSIHYNSGAAPVSPRPEGHATLTQRTSEIFMHVDLLAIAYLSTAAKWPTRSQLEILLLDARDFNERVGVTGALLLQDLTFFQYFEGPESAVLEVYARINRSRLHHSIFELFNEPIERRHFSRWTMVSLKRSRGICSGRRKLSGEN